MIHKTPFNRMVKKESKDEFNWIPSELLPKDSASAECFLFSDVPLGIACSFEGLDLPMLPLTALRLGEGFEDWNASIDLITSNPTGKYQDYTLTSFSSRLNSVLNDLFKLPRDQVSIFNLSPLLPICLPWCLVLDFITVDEPEPVITTILPCKQTLSEMYNQKTILPIEIWAWGRIPDFDLYPVGGNPVAKQFLPLVDFLIYEISESNFERCLWRIEFTYYPHRKTIGVNMNHQQAVKLGTRDGIGIYCVPFLTNSVYEIRKPVDFVKYLTKVYANLNDNSCEKQFTTLVDAFPDIDTTSLSFNLVDKAVLSVYIWYII
jgi:hypothetical protein